MDITLKMLEDWGACGEEVELFVRTFVEYGSPSVEITPDNIERAVDAKLSLMWLAVRLPETGLMGALAYYTIYYQRQEALNSMFGEMCAGIITQAEYWLKRNACYAKYDRVMRLAGAELLEWAYCGGVK